MWYTYKVMYMRIKKDKKKKSCKNLFYKIISGLLVIMSIAFLGILFYLDLIPSKYMTIITISIILFDLFNIVLININKLKRKIKKFLSVFVILAIIIMLFVSFYLCRTIGVLLNNGDSKYKLEHYSVMVFKDNGYDSLSDIKGKTIGYYANSTGTKQAKEELNKEIDVNFKSYKDSIILINNLQNSKIDAILIEDSIKNILNEESSDLLSSMKVIYTFTIKVSVESTLKEVDVTKEPFAVYISGIDTYGQISSVSRSDVNMVMVMNPETKQVLLISIPRDYYVQLHGTKGSKDKITHAGIYGIDMSINTIEDLLDTDINYYIKVNFTSVIDIVDALGGLDVYSEYSFISYSGFNFKKGYNKVNGEQALDFVRTRKAFIDGDRQRGKNQQALIESIIRKATDKSIITKYNSLLSAVDGKYQTNMSTKKITSLIKMQLEDMSSWNITSYSLTGKDSTNYTYTYNQLLYVMEPDQESVQEAINLIKKVLDDKKLDSSYGKVTSSSNKVTKVPTPTVNKENVTQEKPEENANDFIETEDEIIVDKIDSDLENNVNEEIEKDPSIENDIEENEKIEIPEENEELNPPVEESTEDIEQPDIGIIPVP